MPDLNCPNCGDLLPARFSVAKMATCPSCDTTLFLDGDSIRNAGESGEMHMAPLLFELGQSVRADGTMFDVVGHARFDYGRGWWDEFWVQGAKQSAWISVDEGDVILQNPVLDSDRPNFIKPPSLGTSFDVSGTNFRVTEANTATCVAIRGMFAEELQVDGSFSYVNCIGEHGILLSGEFSEGDPDWYLGKWLDPFDVPRGVKQ